MTIALGILSDEGIVVAADTEYSLPELKMNHGKVGFSIMGAGRGKPRPTFCISGAGNSSYVEALIHSEMDKFHKFDIDYTMEDLENSLKSSLSAFFAEHVTPFGGFPTGERPYVTLLLASQNNDAQRLWYTENNLVVQNFRYAAVGAGAMFARILLGQLWTPHMELRRTALLAAYVVYLVKQCIPGCGQDTTMAILSKTGGVHVGTKEVRVMEAAFEKYRDVESTVLHYAITGGGKVSLGGLSAALKKARRDIGASFKKAIQ